MTSIDRNGISVWMWFWTTDCSYNDFFNSAPWPLPGHPEPMKREPPPRLFSHQPVAF
jgi:hypothetical protein